MCVAQLLAAVLPAQMRALPRQGFGAKGAFRHHDADARACERAKRLFPVKARIAGVQKARAIGHFKQIVQRGFLSIHDVVGFQRENAQPARLEPAVRFHRAKFRTPHLQQRVHLARAAIERAHCGEVLFQPGLRGRGKVKADGPMPAALARHGGRTDVIQAKMVGMRVRDEHVFYGI